METTVFKNIFINGEICDMETKDGKITFIGESDKQGKDFLGMRVFPGLVDIHTHGIGGIDTMDADFSKMPLLYAKHGTTTFYPTTTTESHESLVKVLTAELCDNGAKIPGVHLEGPYINDKYIGAQNINEVRNPDINEFKGFDRAKIITLAPELDGAIDFIKETDMVVCFAHTAADYDTAYKASKAGAKCLSHTFNAMPPLHHREPAVIGAAFDTDMYVQVICDGKHLHPAIIRILYKMFGPDRMILISDSMRATLLSDGEYMLGGVEVIVKDSTARTKSGALAGSTSTLFDCVMCAVEFGIDINDAFKMASETPAKMLNLNCGKLDVGYDCDFIVLNNDNTINTVVINGKEV